MKILLAGQSGLIGSEIFHLLKRKHKVYTLSRNEHADICLDLGNADDISRSTFENYDCFIHSAGVTDEDLAKDAPKALARSVINHSILVDKLIASGTSNFIYISTAHVYGSFQNISNESSPSDPLSEYSIAHYAAEQVLKARVNSSGIKAFILRPMAVFGIPRNIHLFKRGHLIPFSFPQNCIDSQTITLNSAGSQKRNFISTQDIASYVGKILQTHNTFNKYSIINPLGAVNMTVFDFATLCSNLYHEIYGQKCKIVRPAQKHNEIVQSFQYLSNYKIHSSTHQLDEYIKSYFARYKK